MWYLSCICTTFVCICHQRKYIIILSILKINTIFVWQLNMDKHDKCHIWITFTQHSSWINLIFRPVWHYVNFIRSPYKKLCIPDATQGLFGREVFMHLSMSCPIAGSADIYELLTRKRCPCQGKFDFFDQCIPKGRDHWHPWLRWTSLGLLLTSHHALPKEKGKQTLNQG